MIRLTQGNLLDAPADALVNTVNEVGVMGKGIALMFKERFPDSAKLYEEAARRGEVRVGKVLTTEGPTNGPKWIIHFPTKKHWRNPSKLEWITEGLVDLARVIRELHIRSIAVPPLGTGNGRLRWDHVLSEIERSLGALTGVDVLVYEPTANYMNLPKASGVESLTPARALAVELVRRYSVLGLDCTNLEVQKLAWFFQRIARSMGLENPLRLRFRADKYGPYADGLRHLLNSLDGSFLHAARRMADAGPFEPIWFEEAKRPEMEAYLRSEQMSPYHQVLEQTTALIDGFESPMGTELLATVDWILTQRHAQPTISSVKRELRRWPGSSDAGERKLRLFDDRLLGVALGRLAADSS